jgi:hypothetical protein
MYVCAATSELSAWRNAHACNRYAATVGPRMTTTSATHAFGGMARHSSLQSDGAAIGSMISVPTANMRATTARAEASAMYGLERTR